MELDLDSAAPAETAGDGTPENFAIFRDPFWLSALDGSPIPGQENVPKIVADAVALMLSRATDQYVPSSECRAVVALVALAAAHCDISIFRREVVLRNLRALASRRCIENTLLVDREAAGPDRKT